MRRLPVLLLLLLLPSVALAGAPFPGGLLDSTGRTAYLAAPDGLAAVDLTAGTVRWRSTEASYPLLVVGDRLFALAGTNAGRLYVRAFELKERGRRVFESEPIEVPRWVVAANGPGRSFAFRTRRDNRRLELTWRAAAWAEGLPRKSAAGWASVDMHDGTVTQRDEPAQQAEPAIPGYLEKFSVRWQQREAGQLRAVVLEELTGSSAFLRRELMVLRRWDEKTARQLPARDLLRGRDLVLLPDVDGRHLWLRDGTTPADLEGRAKWEWVVVNAADGREVAKATFVAGTLAATIVEKRAYYLTVASVRAENGKVASKGYALAAVDLASGEMLWKVAVGAK